MGRINDCLITPQHEIYISSLYLNRQGNILFNDTLNTFLFTALWHLKDNETGNPTASTSWATIILSCKGYFICTG